MIFRQLILVCLVLANAWGIFAQTSKTAPQIEIDQDDGIPVLVKHLPDWENVRTKTSFIRNSAELRSAAGDRPFLDLIDFTGGTEAVFASYNTGKLLLVEFSSPATSIETDIKVKERLAQSGQNFPVVYRRIGNYNAFVFDPADEAQANALLDQVKYEKVVQWLGEDPFLAQRIEHSYVETTADMFLSSFIYVAIGLSISLSFGIFIGYLVFRSRKKKHAAMTAFSDAGGMTRLNLDELSE
jgi:hypothetical protein